MREIEITTKYKKDYKAAIKQNLPIEKLDEVIQSLQSDIPLPPQNHDHPLQGKYKDCQECHITPDWLLIYKIDNEILTLVLFRTGTHSDLF